MKARVKVSYRWNSLIAFSGFEFVKGEFRPVPAGSEAQALEHDALEIEQEPKLEIIPENPAPKRGKK